jgi:hypothetical protein
MARRASAIEIAHSTVQDLHGVGVVDDADIGRFNAALFEDALRQIVKLKPTPVGDDFVTGPQAILYACQRIARAALRKSKKK